MEQKEQSEIRLQHEKSTATSCADAIAPLAFHLFPDGCPVIGVVSETEFNYLQHQWPKRDVRRTVSTAAAIQALAALNTYAVIKGLEPAEMVVVTILACSTVPCGPSRVHSPLIDGSATYFLTLVRCLLPKEHTSINHRSLTPMREQLEAALRVIVVRLLSIGCRFRNTKKSIPDSHAQDAQSSIRRCILRFLLLVIPCMGGSTRTTLDNTIKTVLFQWAMNPTTTEDSLRILWHLACPIPVFRLNQLRNMYEECLTSDRNVPLRLVLSQMLARYNILTPNRSSTNCNISDWTQFPDSRWEHDFSGENRCAGGGANDEKKKTWKKRRHSSRSLQPFIGFIETTLATEQSSDRSACQNIGVNMICIATATASEILKDPFLQHLSAIGADMSDDRFKFGDVLPHKLLEQWYDSNHDARRSLMLSFEDHALRLGTLPLEVQNFLVNNVLSTWDGDIDTEVGRLFLRDVLPYVQTTGDGITVDPTQSIASFLESFFLYGDDRLHYEIVSASFTTFIHQWFLNHAHFIVEMQVKQASLTFRGLIQSIDDVILKGFLVCDDGDEMLRSSAIDFYNSVCDIYVNASKSFLFEVAAPSPSLMYRLLLSPSVVNIDRACKLLVRYKDIFQAWQTHHTRMSSDAAIECGTVEKSNNTKKIKVYNCFIWDFCSVLWRCSRPPMPNAFSARVQTEINDDPDPSARTYSILYTDVRPKIQEILYNARICSRALSITHGAVFVAYSSRFLESMGMSLPAGEYDDSHVPYDRICGKRKIQYLDFLNERGLHGITSFLSTFVGSLASRKAKLDEEKGEK